MNVARVLNGVVVNIEVADSEWIAANSPAEDGSILVPYTYDQSAYIGLGWSATTGFEQPASEDAELTQELDALLADGAE